MAATFATPDFFDTLFDVLPTGVLLLGPCFDASGQLVDFTLDALNPAGQRALGLPAHPGVTLLQQFPHNVTQGIFARYQQAYLSGERLELDVPYQADGLDSYYHIVVQRVSERLLMHFTDLTMLDAGVARQALREAAAARLATAQREREQLHAIFMQAPVAIAVYRGPAYTIELANPTVCRLWGRQAEDIVGKGLFEALPEVAGMGYEELLDGVLATGQPVVVHGMEAQHERNGRRETVYWDFVYEPLSEADGTLSGVMVVANEVTAQVQAQRQVEQSNQALEARVQARTAQVVEQQGLLRQVLSNVPAAIATFSGPEHRFTFANSLYQQLVGHRVTVGQPVAEALPEVTEQGVIELLDRVYQTGEPFIGREILLMLEQPPSPPHHYHYDLTYLPLRDGQGQVQGILVFAVKVSERVEARRQRERLNQELAAMNEELQATNQALHQRNAQLTRTNTDLDTFVYTASHDLKAPITNIEGLVGALQAELEITPPAAGSIAYLLELMQDAVGRFQATIGHLTDLTYQTGQPLTAEEVSIADLLDSVYLDLAPELLASQGRLVLDLTDCPPRVRTSSKNLRSIFYNLLSNALKYQALDRPPLVQVRVQCTAHTLDVQVQDNGLGLSEQQQGNLFKLFRRLHTHVAGSGVGLYAIKRLIDNAGGLITVQSQQGVGTLFRVHLPL